MERTILFVDDDKYFEYIMRELIEEQDFILFQPDVASAISYLQSLHDDDIPGLIVTDYNFPSLNGIDFLQFLKANSKLSAVEVVVLTNYISPQEKTEILKAGAKKIYNKSHKLEELQAMLSSFKELASGQSV